MSMSDFRQDSWLKRKSMLVTFQSGFALLAAFSAAVDAAPTLDDQVVAGPCVNCHGPDGRSPGAIPSIAGLPEAELKAKLLAFKSDAPPAASPANSSAGSTASSTASSTANSTASVSMGITAGTTIMNRLAKGYTDDQIAALAHYYEQMKPAAGAATGVKP